MFALTGIDARLFNIDSTTGEITTAVEFSQVSATTAVTAAPYSDPVETTTDGYDTTLVVSDGSRAPTFTVTATDGYNTVSAVVMVTVIEPCSRVVNITTKRCHGKVCDATLGVLL